MIKGSVIAGALMAAGYSGKPLWQMLGIKPGMTVAAVGAPANYRRLLGAVPPGVTIAAAQKAGAEFIHVFVTKRSALAVQLVMYRRTMAKDGTVWVSWPKKSSKEATDITEDVIRDVAIPLGLVDVKVCAVDERWSGLKLVVRREFR